MVVIVSERGVHVGQRKLREIGHDLVRRPALLGPEDDVLDANPVAGNPSPTAAYAGRDLDVDQMKERMAGLMRNEGLAYGDRRMTYNSRKAQELASWAVTQDPSSAPSRV